MSVATNDNFSFDLAREKSDCGVIEIERKSDWKALNRAPFIFRHNLENHPLFEIPRLIDIAESAAEKGRPGNVYVPEDPELKKLPWKQRFTEAIRRIEGGSLWLKISQMQELHSDYRELLQDILVEMEDLSGLPLRQTVTWAGLTVFVASPNVVTPYHFDHDTNFLFQIRGRKDVYLFDRSVVNEQEIERFYAGDLMAGKFREGMLDKSELFHLVPGTAVHHPPLAPHLIKNGDNVSISLSIFYADRFLDGRARTYQANYCLRRLGFRPRPPGQHAFRDRLKSSAINIFSNSNPKTQDDLLYSGFRRAFSPLRGANRIAKRALSGHG